MADYFLASGRGGRLKRSIETLLFVREERAIMLCFMVILFVNSLFDLLFCGMLPIIVVTPMNISVCVLKKDVCL